MTEPDARDRFMNGVHAEKRLDLFFGEFAAAGAQTPETAIYVSGPETLAKLPLDRFSRVYLGAEFCEKNMPSPEDCDAAASAARSAGLPLTLVTPYMTEAGLVPFKQLIRHAAEAYPDMEVVVNDWGALNFIRRETPGLRPVAGRVLIRQKKDPRIVHVQDGGMNEYFSQSLLDSRRFTDFLAREGVGRAELDNPPHGVDFPDPAGAPALSLYFPYVFLTTSRQCVPGRCENCRNTKYILRNSLIERELVYIGRSQFYINTDLSLLRSGRISRIVYQYTLPG